MSLQKVLICGKDAKLLTTREMVLAQAGFDVISACTQFQMRAIPRSSETILGVVGHTLTEAEQLSASQEMRELWPEIKILFLSETHLELQKVSCREYRCSSDDPAHFVEMCRQIVDASEQSDPNNRTSQIS
jgi:DNA-binding response OmpR family regulator